MQIGVRDSRTVIRALVQRQHYVAAINMLRVYERPLEMFSRYLTGRGKYPARIGVRTPLGPIALNAYSHHDVLTINEIFCRHDYKSESNDEIFVDFGSNIGISAAYFLTRNKKGYAYLFEPVPSNVQRLHQNLKPFRGRFELNQCAVGTHNGKAEFGCEPTGRYGGIGFQSASTLVVDCRDSNQILEDILTKHNKIDVLKIDIETLEEIVTKRIPDSLCRQIHKIFVEYSFKSNPLRHTHEYYQYGSVARLRLRDARASKVTH